MTLAICGILCLLLHITVLGFIFSDLFAGVRKAKKAGIMRTSEAYKRTIGKIARYYNMLIPLTLVDCMQVAIIFYLHWYYGFDIPMLPVFTALGTCYIGFVEIKSIFEPVDVKEKKHQEDFLRTLKALSDDAGKRSEVLAAINVLVGAMNSNKEK